MTNIEFRKLHYSKNSEERDIYNTWIEKIEHPKVHQMYIAGKIYYSDLNAIAVVGSRKITSYGKEACEYFVKTLAAAGMTVVSGLMYGVDVLAHQTALLSGGRTIAITGYGYEFLSRSSYANVLANKIVRSNSGAIISEFSPEQIPDKWTFPKRNRIIAAISKAVLIIEAGEKSGSLITADIAADLGIPVFVIPGSIFSPQSKGGALLIKQGASLCDDPYELLELLQVPFKKDAGSAPKQLDTKNFDQDTLKVIKSLEKFNILTLSEISSITALEAKSINQIITNLELMDFVKLDELGRIRLIGLVKD